MRVQNVSIGGGCIPVVLVRRREGRSAVPILVGVLLVAGLSTSAVAQIGPASPTVPVGPAGTWDGPWDWTCEVGSAQDQSGNTCDNQEFSVASVIPQGPYRGLVMLWHRQVTSGTCASSNTTQVFLLDPTRPEKLFQVDSPLSSDIFCAGLSWDPQGRLVVAGGELIGHLPPNQTYRFHPEWLSSPAVECYPPDPCCPHGILGDPWDQQGDMSQRRYYPTVVTLCKSNIATNSGQTDSCNTAFPSNQIAGGSSIVAGGQVDPIGNNDKATEFWQLLPPLSACWSQTLYPNFGIIHPLPPVTEMYQGRSFASLPLPEVRLASYPRILQLGNIGGGPVTYLGNILVANDLRDGTELPTLNTAPGDSWVMRPRYGSSPPAQWEFWRGPSASTAPPPSHNNDRLYGSAVLLHTRQFNLPTSDGKNRVLVFGGISPISATQWQVTGITQELNPGNNPAGDDPAGSGGGRWITKNPGIATPRLYNNAVILPTGEIMITGGATHIRPSGAAEEITPGSGLYNEGPEIYNPGLSGAAGGGVSTTMLQMPPGPGGSFLPFVRLYHNYALLLPDGRVLTGGGSGYGIAPPRDPRFTAEIFSPPYLGYGFRPRIARVYNSSGTTEVIPFSTLFNVDVRHANVVDRIVLLRPAAVTHNFDADQRYIELAWGATTWNAAHTIETFPVTAPTDDLGPPGYYTLWVVEHDPAQASHRVPSSTAFVLLQ